MPTSHEVFQSPLYPCYLKWYFPTNIFLNIYKNIVPFFRPLPNGCGNLEDSNTKFKMLNSDGLIDDSPLLEHLSCCLILAGFSAFLSVNTAVCLITCTSLYIELIVILNRPKIAFHRLLQTCMQQNI